jgi:hypothetical protein
LTPHALHSVPIQHPGDGAVEIPPAARGWEAERGGAGDGVGLHPRLRPVCLLLAAEAAEDRPLLPRQGAPDLSRVSVWGKGRTAQATAVHRSNKKNK